MQSVECANLIAGRGLEGDRYSLGQGTYSALPEVGRQLTLMSEHVLEHEFFQNSNTTTHAALLLDIGQLRRNVVVRGISPSDLLATVGQVLTIVAPSSSSVGDGSTPLEGEPHDPNDDDDNSGAGCQLLVHRNCVPCPYNERLNQLPGLQEALWLDMGVSCEILRGGTIQRGDAVRIIDDCQHPQQPHHGGVQDPHVPSFYVPPKQRTAAMVRAAVADKRALHQQLLVQDPEGAARLQASYQKVGLSFWPLAARDPETKSDCAK